MFSRCRSRLRSAPKFRQRRVADDRLGLRAQFAAVEIPGVSASIFADLVGEREIRAILPLFFALLEKNMPGDFTAQRSG